MSRDAYPCKSYEIPTGQNVKKALKDFDIHHILTYTPEKADQQTAIDFWIFSYLCSGINFADIISLKPANISAQGIIQMVHWLHYQARASYLLLSIFAFLAPLGLFSFKASC